MAKWTSYFKFVTPSPDMVKMSDSQEMTDVGAYNNYTWYQRLIQGSASRMTRYREYDLMDNDVEVARALDTIAEEMSGNNPKTDEPIEVDILTEDENHVESSAVLTVKAAVRRWVKAHEWETKIFKVSRMLVKYGDVFFRKPKQPFEKWTFIHPKNVVAAIVDADDATKIVAWQIKKDIKKPKSGGYSMPIGAKQDSQYETEIVSAKEMVRFTLNDDMSDTAPFGESILRSVYRSHKQKELLEDAIIIYRVQRAPERRVFYIDVGKMPPQRVKQYLENIKNEIKQKKIPNINGGQMEVDSVYNPQSMCLALDTKIPLLDGRVETLQTLISEFDGGKENWAYSIDPETGDIVPGLISWAGVTRKNTETIKLTLDNAKEIICTPDHKFPVQGKGFDRVMAKDLTEGDSLWPFHTKQETISRGDKQTRGKYTQVYNPGTKGWNFFHRKIVSYMQKHHAHNTFVFNGKYKGQKKNTIHHANMVSTDNTPSNLVLMSHQDHVEMHQSLNNNQSAEFNDILFERFNYLAQQDIYIKFKDLMIKINNDSTFMGEYARINKPKTSNNKLKTSEFRQKMFLVFIKQMGFKNWKEYQQHIIQSRIDEDTFVNRAKTTPDGINLLRFVVNLIKNVGIHNFALVNYLKKQTKIWNDFCCLYERVFSSKFKNRIQQLSTPEASMFERIAKYFGYNNFKHLVSEAALVNHRVVKIEKGPVIDTGTLTIDGDHKFHDYHNFAICFSKKNTELDGVFTANSEDFFFASRPDGRGSRVETLPGGQGLGELSDLEYFQRKVWRGLRVPASYMIEQQDGGQIFNDGKVGVAYIQELRFAMFVMRLQSYVENELDLQFKKYLRSSNIRIDETMYRLRLPEPSNFGKYRQFELDSALLGSFGGADGIEYFSKRFILKRFLQMSDEEIIRNERLLREERGMDPDGGKEDYPQLYVAGQAGAMGGLGGGGFGGGLGPIGGGLGGTEMGMEAGAEGEAGMVGGVPGAEAPAAEGGAAAGGAKATGAAAGAGAGKV